MNVIGKTLTVKHSTDPTIVGRSGQVVLESARTLILDHDGSAFRVEKAGTSFEVLGQTEALNGRDLAGRLEDRWGNRV